MAEASFAAQEFKRFVAVGGYVNYDGRLKGAQGFLHKANVGGVVLDDENISTVEHALTILSCRGHACEDEVGQSIGVRIAEVGVGNQ